MDFYGPYAHIRETLDYEYHSNYTQDRQRLQNAIIYDILDDVLLNDVNGNKGTIPRNPWIVFTAGPMGAGKGYTMNLLVERGLFPIDGFVTIDPDEVRRRLPEYALYVKNCPLKAGDLTRKEAGFITEILTLASLQAGKNAIVDGSLRDHEWYKNYFSFLRKNYPYLRIAIIHVFAPREVVFERAELRGKVTGRVIPRNMLELALEQVPKSVKILSTLVDYFCEILNAPNKDIQIVTEGETWDTFSSKWQQKVAVVKREMPKSTSILVRRRSISRSCFTQSLSTMFPRNPKSQYSTSYIFSVDISTVDNYKTNEMKFYGAYSHIRASLDYDFSFTKERQWIQNSIIDETLKLPSINNNAKNASRIPKDPWIVFFVGISSVGKSHCIRELVCKGRLSLSSSYYVDTNLTELHLPEYNLYAKENLKGRSQLMGLETFYISQIITYGALQKEKNIILNIKPGFVDRAPELCQKICTDYPSYRIALIHVDADTEEVFKRDVVKYKAYGGNFEKDDIEIEREDVSDAVEAMKQNIDYYCKLFNSSGKDIQIETEGETWGTFSRKWIQKISWSKSFYVREAVEPVECVCPLLR